MSTITVTVDGKRVPRDLEKLYNSVQNADGRDYLVKSFKYSASQIKRIQMVYTTSVGVNVDFGDQHLRQKDV